MSIEERLLIGDRHWGAKRRAQPRERLFLPETGQIIAGIGFEFRFADADE